MACKRSQVRILLAPLLGYEKISFVLLDLFVAGQIEPLFLLKAETAVPFVAKRRTERAGFEPAVQTSRTQPFQGCSISHSDTSPKYQYYVKELLLYHPA